MKILAALLLVFVVAAIGLREMLWRLDHFPISNVVGLAPENYIAQGHILSEGSIRPYGQGVFVRHRYIPLWATAKLVFAGYCKPEMRLAVVSAKQLTVHCVVAEGTVVQFPSPGGFTVVHDSSP